MRSRFSYPARAQTSGSFAILSSTSARESASPAGVRNGAAPGPSTSRTPSTSVAATGNPAAMLSNTALGQPSDRELNTLTSTALNNPDTSVTGPANLTLSLILNSAASVARDS